MTEEVAVDLDGTLTIEDVGALPQSVFNDRDYIDLFLENCTPALGIEVFNDYGIHPLVITGRDEPRREITLRFLNKIRDIFKFKALIMCPENYYLENGILKFTWKKYTKLKLNQHQNRNIKHTFDDKQCAVDLLNQHGFSAHLVQRNLREVVERVLLEDKHVREI